MCLPCVVFLLLWRDRLSLLSPSSQPAEREARQREQLEHFIYGEKQFNGNTL